MKIKIQYNSNRLDEIIIDDMKPQDTLKSLKEKIQEKTKLPPYKQKITIERSELRHTLITDQYFLEDICRKNEKKINVTLREKDSFGSIVLRFRNFSKNHEYDINLIVKEIQRNLKEVSLHLQTYPDDLESEAAKKFWIVIKNLFNHYDPKKGFFSIAKLLGSLENFEKSSSPLSTFSEAFLQIRWIILFSLKLTQDPYATFLLLSPVLKKKWHVRLYYCDVPFRESF